MCCFGFADISASVFVAYGSRSLNDYLTLGLVSKPNDAQLRSYQVLVDLCVKELGKGT